MKMVNKVISPIDIKNTQSALGYSSQEARYEIFWKLRNSVYNTVNMHTSGMVLALMINI